MPRLIVQIFFAVNLLIAQALPFSALAAPISFTDIAGRSIELSSPPKSIAVGNYILNFLLVGGASSLEHIKGITADGWEEMRYGEYQVCTQAFPQLKDCPSIGGYHDDILDAEKILSLHPEVLLVNLSQFAANNEHIDIFERAGIHVVVLDYHAMKIENHLKSTRILGALLERSEVAEKQCQIYASTLEEIKRRIKEQPASQHRKRVYMELGNKGVGEYGNTYNKDVLWGSILKTVDAANLAEDSQQPYGTLDTEKVLSSDPEIILIGGSIWHTSKLARDDQMRMGFTVKEEDAQQRLKAFASRPAWQQLSAVKTGDIYAVDHSSLRNMADYTFTLFIAKILYPQAFEGVDPAEEMHRFYTEFLPELPFEGTFMLKLNR